MDVTGILKWFDDHGVGLQGLGTVIAGIAAILTIFVTSRNARDNKIQLGQVVPPTISPAHVVGALAERELPENPARRQARPRRSPDKIIADLQAVRSALMPPPLNDILFPPGLDVISFVPNQHIRIRMPQSRGIVSSGGWFTLLHFAFLPAGLIGSITGSPAVAIVSAACSLTYWAYLVFWRGAVATIKLREQRWSLTSVAGCFWNASVNSIQIERRNQSDHWATYILFNGHMLWEHVAIDQNEGTILAQPFVNSLKAALDIPIEIADGILISFK
ncbi:hypothetical protein [Methylobacterium tarhaniae]|uniref:hypothetical protein n=1 Tax=Methylobacterium tarhaniae TaxID=1187852 RepID=UPI003CFDE5C7